MIMIELNGKTRTGVFLHQSKALTTTAYYLPLPLYYGDFALQKQILKFFQHSYKRTLKCLLLMDSLLLKGFYASEEKSHTRVYHNCEGISCLLNGMTWLTRTSMQLKQKSKIVISLNIFEYSANIPDQILVLTAEAYSANIWINACH